MVIDIIPQPQQHDRHHQHPVSEAALVPQGKIDRGENQQHLDDRDHRPPGVARRDPGAIADCIGDDQQLRGGIDPVPHRQRGDQSEQAGIGKGSEFVEQLEPARVAVGLARQDQRERHPDQGNAGQRKGEVGDDRNPGQRSDDEAGENTGPRPHREVGGLGIERLDQGLLDPVIDRIGAEQHPQQGSPAPYRSTPFEPLRTNADRSPKG
jgi:hypothetical protein